VDDGGKIAHGWVAARTAWPGIDVNENDFAQWVRERGDNHDEMNMRDLYLACACHRGDPAALAAFDRVFSASISAALASMRMRDEHGEEIRQRLRTKLFTGAKRIASYRGRGELGGWVRAATIREALDLRRQHQREVIEEDPLARLTAAPLADPALAAMKEQYRDQMAAAFSAALASLAAEDRTLLRFKYIDNATLDEIAAIHRVHRATIARRFAQLRAELAVRTREQMQTALGVGRADAESIIRLVQSQVDASLPGLE